MTGAVGRALGMLVVIFQSYFNGSPSSQNTPVIALSEQFVAHGHLAGLILARKGSKGIPHKNLIDLNGHPLIHWALDAMVQSKVFSSVWVSTDDKEMMRWLSKAYSKINIHKRAPYTATDTASSIIAVQEFLNHHPEIDTVGLVQATSPFITPMYLIQAASLLTNFDSVFSATRSHQLRWKFSNNPSVDTTTAINFNPRQRPRRQDWNGELVENGMFYFAKRELIVNHGVFQGPKSTYVEVPKIHSMEIDSPIDLEVARCLMMDKKSQTIISSAKNTTINYDSKKTEL